MAFLGRCLGPRVLGRAGRVNREHRLPLKGRSTLCPAPRASLLRGTEMLDDYHPALARAPYPLRGIGIRCDRKISRPFADPRGSWDRAVVRPRPAMEGIAAQIEAACARPAVAWRRARDRTALAATVAGVFDRPTRIPRPLAPRQAGFWALLQNTPSSAALRSRFSQGRPFILAFPAQARGQVSRWW